jgi:hypothetical protein
MDHSRVVFKAIQHLKDISKSLESISKSLSQIENHLRTQTDISMKLFEEFDPNEDEREAVEAHSNDFYVANEVLATVTETVTGVRDVVLGGDHDSES